MKKREYKVKIENGEIKPLEPIDLTNVKEGIIIIFEEEHKEYPKPIWDTFEEIVKEISKEELNKIPSDAAEQHDHYIYGTPKREL